MSTLSIPAFTSPLPSPHSTVYTDAFPFALQDAENLVPAKGRFYHSGEVNIRGSMVFPFCSAISSPGLRPVVSQIKRAIIDLTDVPPGPATLDLVAAGLRALTELTELTLVGFPAPNADGWVLRNTTFVLTRFTTNLPLTSRDVIDFLSRQPALTEISTTTPPPESIEPRRSRTHFAFPNDAAPALRALECPAPFLLSLLGAMPPTRQIRCLRLDFNRMHPLVEMETLRVLSMFSASVEKLSLCRSVLRVTSAPASMGEMMDVTSIIDRISTKRQWAKLRFLELRDGMYQSSALPGLAVSIGRCCPNVDTIVWAPSSHTPGATIVVPLIATIFFTFCLRLRQFVFLDDVTKPEDKKYISIVKVPGGSIHEEDITAHAVETMWRS